MSGTANLERDDLRRAAVVVSMRENRPKYDKAVSAEWGWHFWSRQAYGLGYACQREGGFDRLQRRAAKLNRQLGGEGLISWDVPPAKPKWMRWRTYEKKYERWRRAVEKADAEFTVRAARLLKWL